MYKYETHLHTFPISGCASASVRESVEYYKELGYDGIFLTNHFPGCYPKSKTPPTYEELMNNYFSAYEEALEIGKEIGIKVFCGIEISYEGIDFLVYGLD
ncbi:MAG: PHP domain-containing protein, partial [Clostridia bacterium]|nr:PHP domain-containing protein [Clostridia bacterium]